jgi:hypothetical protein
VIEEELPKKRGSAAAPDGNPKESDDNYEEEEFEKLLDKPSSSDGGGEQEKKSVSNDGGAHKKGDQKREEGGEYIDEEEMLDIAEKCFLRIAEAIVAKGFTVREAFKKHIKKEIAALTNDSKHQEELELISPMGFLEAVKSLGISDFSEMHVACLMRILTKPDLENAILVEELIIIMENFGL